MAKKKSELLQMKWSDLKPKQRERFASRASFQARKAAQQSKVDFATTPSPVAPGKTYTGLDVFRDVDPMAGFRSQAQQQAAQAQVGENIFKPQTQAPRSTGVGGPGRPKPATSSVFEQNLAKLEDVLTEQTQEQDNRYSTLQNQLLAALGGTERPTVGGVRAARRSKQKRQLATMGATGTFGRSGLRIRSLNI